MTTTPTSLKPLIGTGARIATALAVAGIVAAAWIGTEHESHRAVQSAATAITGPLYVTLPAVEIVGERMKDGDAVAAMADAQRAL